MNGVAGGLTVISPCVTTTFSHTSTTGRRCCNCCFSLPDSSWILLGLVEKGILVCDVTVNLLGNFGATLIFPGDAIDGNDDETVGIFRVLRGNGVGILDARFESWAIEHLPETPGENSSISKAPDSDVAFVIVESQTTKVAEVWDSVSERVLRGGIRGLW